MRKTLTSRPGLVLKPRCFVHSWYQQTSKKYLYKHQNHVLLYRSKFSSSHQIFKYSLTSRSNRVTKHLPTFRFPLFHHKYASFTSRLRIPRRLPWQFDRIVAGLIFAGVMGAWWFILGTTSFLGAALYATNSLPRVQDYIAVKLSDYLSFSTGVRCNIGSMSADWEKHRIHLTNVKLFRDHKEALKVNGSQLDLHIHKVDVKVSFINWLLGKGLVEKISFSTVRGMVDRTNIQFNPLQPPTKRVKQKGDFEFANVKVEDVLLTFYNPNPKRPLTIVLKSLEIENFRKHYLLHDLLTRSVCNGTIDGSKFTILPKDSEENVRQVKLMGVSVDHLASNTTGPVSWLTSGRLDVCFDIKEDDPETEDGKLSMMTRVVMKHLTADVPRSPHELSYLRSALIRPVVFYLNNNYTEFPLNFEMVIPQSELDGAWYLGDIKFWDRLSDSAGKEISRVAQDYKQVKNVWELLVIGSDGVKRGAVYLWDSYVKAASDYIPFGAIMTSP